MAGTLSSFWTMKWIWTKSKKKEAKSLIFFVKVTVIEFCYNPIFFRWGDGMVDLVSDEKKTAFKIVLVNRRTFKQLQYWIRLEIGP